MTDKRVIKTKNAIKKAFMELMYQKDINKITVSDIAEHALINRSTFYLHYSDVLAVWKEIEDDLADQISEDVAAFDISDIPGSTSKLFHALYTNIDDVNAFNTYILKSTNSKYIIERLKEIMIESSLKGYAKTHLNYKPENEYLITFIASGTIDTYIKWAGHKENNIPLETLCSIVSSAIQSAVDSQDNK